MEKSRLELVSKLGEIASTLSAVSDIDTLIGSVCQFIEQTVHVEYGGFYLLDPDLGVLRLHKARGFTEEERNEAEATAMDRHPGWVFENKEVLLISDTSKSSSGNSKDSKRSFSVNSRLWLPVMCLNKSVGSFGLASSKSHQFTEEHVSILSFICNVTGVVYGNILLKLEQEKNEEQLITALDDANRAKKAKESFLAKMSHEIRTPMNAIVGMAGLLKKTELSEKQQSYLKAVSISSNNLLDLLNDILDFSKIEAEQFKLEKIPFELRHTLEKVFHSLKYKAHEKGLQLKHFIAEDVPHAVTGDSLRLSQVLINLVNNSIKFTREGSVTISCEVLSKTDEDCMFRFRVDDTGIGIEKENQAHIFESFRQEDDSTTRKFGGSGLGLAIVKEIIDLHEGKIWLESERGKGASFIFELRLPIADPAAIAKGSMETEDNRNLEGIRVLVVEDNEINRFVARTFLEQKAAAEIGIAENGQIAVEMLQEREFDVVLMDMQMPVMDGKAATRFIRDELKLNVPIIALTANAIRGDNEACLRFGMDDYLCKPFNISHLVSKILKLVHPEESNRGQNSAFLQAVEDESIPFSLENFEQLTAGNPALLQKMLSLLIEKLPLMAGQMKAHFDVGNIKEVKATAHKLKPTIDNLKIEVLHLPIREIEQYDMEGGEPKELQTNLQQTLLVLDNIVDDLQEVLLKVSA